MSRRVRGLATALGLAAALGPLAGCLDLAPADRRPPLAVPAALPAGGAYPEAAPAAQADAPGAPWRAVFVDPRLQQVIDAALAGNRDLRIAVANVAAARAQYHIARSDLAPKLNAVGQANYGQIPNAVLYGGRAGAPAGAYNVKSFTLEGQVSAWQLDLFGKLRDLARASLEQYFATREARDAAQITLVGEVAGDWLTLGADRAQLALARQTLASSQQSQDLVKARFAAGVASDLDAAQAETLVEQARFDAARLSAQVEADRNALQLVVGAPVADALLPDDIPAEGVVVSRIPAGLPSRLLLARPDVAAAEDQLKAANANIGAARAAFFPDISLTASGGLTSLALSTLFKGASQTWSFAPTITQPIFEAGANRANLAYAKAQRDAALAGYDKAVQTAFREMADALAQRAAIGTELDAQARVAGASDRAAGLADARYARGVDSYLSVLVARRVAYVAGENLIATRLAQATNTVTLYTALGGGLK